MKVIEANAISSAHFGKYNTCKSIDSTITTKNANDQLYMFVIENEAEFEKFMDLKKTIIEDTRKLAELANNPNSTLEQRTELYNKIEAENEKITKPLQNMCDGVVDKAYGVFWIEYDKYANYECEYVASTLDLAKKIAESVPKNAGQVTPHVVGEIQVEKSLDKTL